MTKAKCFHKISLCRIWLRISGLGRMSIKQNFNCCYEQKTWLARTGFHWKAYLEDNDSDENNFNKIKVNIKIVGMIWVLGRKLTKKLNWRSGEKESSQSTFLWLEYILVHVLWIHFWICMLTHSEPLSVYFWGSLI